MSRTVDERLKHIERLLYDIIDHLGVKETLPRPKNPISPKIRDPHSKDQ